MEMSEVRLPRGLPRVYLSGPITGVVGHLDVFKSFALRVYHCWGAPVVPQEIEVAHEGPCPPGPMGSGEKGHVWACHLRKDLREMLLCDAVAMLPLWETSHGARLEQQVAAACGMPLFYFSYGQHRAYNSAGQALSAWVRNQPHFQEARP